MAGIDHTIMLFKNGLLLDDISDIAVDEVSVKFGRDLNLHEVVLGGQSVPVERIESNLDYHYEEQDGLSYKIPFRIRTLLQRILPKKKVADVAVLMAMVNNVEIIGYETAEYNALFVFGNESTYIGIGGYGHYCNPYTHFYHRGFGRMFEKKMGIECYRWLYDDVLENALRIKFDMFDSDEKHAALKIRGGYKGYWDMTNDERNKFYV